MLLGKDFFAAGFGGGRSRGDPLTNKAGELTSIWLMT